MTYGDSLFAHGTVGRLAIASPLPVDRLQTPAPGKIQFASDTNWLYTLGTNRRFPNVDARRARNFWQRNEPHFAGHQPARR